MRVLLDTNALLSAFSGRKGFPARILDAWHSDRFVLVTCLPVVQELTRVSQYPHVSKRLEGREDEVQVLLDELHRLAPDDPPSLALQVLTDPDDNAVLAAAVEGGADCLVTGNKHHFDELGESYEGIEILSPREFWERLEDEAI